MQYLFSAVRVEVCFSDEDSEWGSAFVLSGKKGCYIVTARHVIEPRYRAPKNGYLDSRQVKKYIIHFHPIVDYMNGRYSLTFAKFDSIEFRGPFLFAEDDTDVAIAFVQKEPFTIAADRSFLMDSSLLETCLPGEPVVFSGFPKGAPVVQLEGFDQKLSTVVRQGIVASPLVGKMDVPDAQGRSYGLLDSYAQRGFSGSPVFARERISTNIEGDNPPHRRAGLIGVVCSHYRTNNDRVDGAHAGLSYFAKSDCILRLLDTLESGSSPS